MLKDPYQYPSTTLTRIIQGDVNYAFQYYGEGENILYQLKNRMRFGKLGQLTMRRIFTDGTIIIAKSVFGQDTVVIDVRQSTVSGAAAWCNINLLNFPPFVQPMRFPGVIQAGEVLNTDYIKTYFIAAVNNCRNCQEMNADFLFTYVKPEESRHYFNPVTGLNEFDNH